MLLAVILIGGLVVWLAYSVVPTCYLKYVRDNHIVPLDASVTKPVMLTFDDGPDPVYTPQLLDLLAANGVQATFFVLADKAERYPDLIQRMQREGHRVAFHALGHQNMWLQSYPMVKDNFDQGLAMLGQQADVSYYRPPYGNVNWFTLRQMKQHQLKLMLWTVMAQDWSAKSTTPIILEKLRRRTEPGAVICLHDSGEGTGGAPGGPARMLAALSQFLPELNRQGYHFLLPEACLVKGGCHELHRRKQEKACL